MVNFKVSELTGDLTKLIIGIKMNDKNKQIEKEELSLSNMDIVTEVNESAAGVDLDESFEYWTFTTTRRLN